MPRRRSLTGEQLEELLALPATDPELIQHWTLGGTDLAAIERRRSDPNQFGFALQLCAFRRYWPRSGRVPSTSHDSNKRSPGRCRLTVFPIRSCLPCYPARSMA